MGYTVLRRGIDSLDVAFQGKLPSRYLSILRQAKAQATSSQKDVLITLGDVDGHVGQTGAQGGYAFRFNTGPVGEIWTFKDNGSPDQWNIRVTVRAVQLALDGYEVVRDRLWAMLEGWGGQVLTESVSRCDFAIDFVADELTLVPDDFVFHSHARCQEHREIPEGGSGFSIERRSGRVTGITVGKMPGRQVTVYDKRLEQAYKIGSPWFDIWGFKKEECPRVWRVEMRAGKTHLKEWGVTTFEDLENNIVEMFGASLQAVRMTAGRDEQNVSRSDVHPFWIIASAEVEKALRPWVLTADRVKIMNTSRAAILDMYSKQINGLCVSYAVAMGMTKEEATKHFADELTANWKSLALGSQAAFGKKFQAAMDRLHFLKEEKLVNGNTNELSSEMPG